MRVAAAGAIAIVAAFLLAQHPTAKADETSPFPSPSPVASIVPGSGGYALVGFEAVSGSGGLIPVINSTATPAPFQPAGASGYGIELVAKLSDRYLGMLHYEDVSIHGDDSSIESRFDVSPMFVFSGSRFAVGLSYASLQRSTAMSTSNGLGFALALLPDFSRRASPYVSAFLYPRLPAGNNTSGALGVLRAGVAFTPPHAQGFFARIGVLTQNFGAPAFSPKSLSGVEFGLGTTF